MESVERLPERSAADSPAADAAKPVAFEEPDPVPAQLPSPKEAPKGVDILPEGIKAVAKCASPQKKGPTILQVKELSVKLHSAELIRSFSKFGRMDPMDPYVVVWLEGQEELHRTAPAKGTHKKPAWDAQFTIPCSEKALDRFTVAVWDKNKFHRDVFCGSATVPCGETAESVDYTLKKKDKPTGQIRISIRVVREEQPSPSPVSSIVPDRAPEDAPLVQPALVPSGNAGGKEEQIVEREPTPPAEPDVPVAPEAPQSEEPLEVERPQALLGKWRCVDTFGLEEFLKAQKVSFFERKIALGAKWPDWEFKADGDKITFLNNTMVGLLTEQISFGCEYDSVDGQKNAWKVNASWIPSDTGGCLLQERSGEKGQFKEERTVNGDKMEFLLTRDGMSWGRKFVRA